eukprot:GEMP01035668.1.p1 GENE.GEMP01035668.1~~GEMP01035668.1.p1  ORF type:complete len:381 (+),score=77.75 GEMP01035668.1:54-1145(+)
MLSLSTVRTFASLSRVPLPPPRTPVKLRNRRGVPCSSTNSIPEFVKAPLEDFPRGFESKEPYKSIEEFALDARKIIEEQLAESKVIVFRGTPAKTPCDFSEFMGHTGYRTQDYLHYLKAMGARSMQSTQVSASIRTASDEPPTWCIEPHCEYHTAGLPSKIVLFCEKPSATQGETILSDNRAIYQQLDPEIREKFERLGVEYEVYYPSEENSKYNCWQKNIAYTKEQVEDYLGALGYTWEWTDTNALRYKKVFPTTVEHDETGEATWFNQLHAHHRTFYQGHPLFEGESDSFNEWPVETRYGDGTPIELEVLARVREVIWKNTIALDLEPGDIVVADNKLCKHGRMPFLEGDKRSIYVSVCYD